MTEKEMLMFQKVGKFMKNLVRIKSLYELSITPKGMMILYSIPNFICSINYRKRINLLIKSIKNLEILKVLEFDGKYFMRR